jgi:hypothetical protein
MERMKIPTRSGILIPSALSYFSTQTGASTRSTPKFLLHHSWLESIQKSIETYFDKCLDLLIGRGKMSLKSDFGVGML